MVALHRCGAEMNQRVEADASPPVPAKMIRAAAQFHYVRGNGSREIRMLGFRHERTHRDGASRPGKARPHRRPPARMAPASPSQPTRFLPVTPRSPRATSASWKTGRAGGRRATWCLKLAERPQTCRCASAMCCWWRRGSRRRFRSGRSTDPALKSAAGLRSNLVLRAHEPNPALAYDRHWNLVSANRMVMPLLEGVPARLLGQPLNILRLAFHPEALAARNRQPRRMVRASAGAVASPVRGDRGSRTDQALSRAESLSDPGTRNALRPTQSRSRSRCGSAMTS